MINKNKELSSKIDEYIAKENAKPKPLLLNIKEEEMPKLLPLFQEIQTTSKEFNETIKLFMQKKSSIFHTQFIEETKLDTNKTCQNWVEQLQKITKERFEAKDNYFEKEIDKLKEDKNILNQEISKLKEELQKIKDENNNLKEEMNLVIEIRNSVDKNKEENEKIVKSLNNTNELLQKRIKEFEDKINTLEINLSDYKFESKMREEELDSAMSLFKSMLEKNKKNFEYNLKKVPEQVKNEILALNKKYKFVKI